MRWMIVVIPFGISALTTTAATTPAANPPIILRPTTQFKTTRNCTVLRHQYDKVIFPFCCSFKNHHDRLVGREIMFLPRTQPLPIPILLCDDQNSATATRVIEFIQTGITSSPMSCTATVSTFVSPIIPPNGIGTTRMRRQSRSTRQKIHDHISDMIQSLWNEILPCITTIFALLMNDVLLLLFVHQRQSPTPPVYFRAWFDQWRTTLQQVWIYHHINASRMMAFIVEQTTVSDDQRDDNPAPPTNRLRTGNNERNMPTHVGSAAAVTDEDTTMTICDPSNNATLTMIDQFLNSHTDTAKLSNVVVGDVIRNRCHNNIDNIRPTIIVSMTAPSTPNDPHATTTGSIATTTTPIEDHDSDDTPAVVDRCLDWNDTITAFVIRLTMIAIMCYLIAISN